MDVRGPDRSEGLVAGFKRHRLPPFLLVTGTEQHSGMSGHSPSLLPHGDGGAHLWALLATGQISR